MRANSFRKLLIDAVRHWSSDLKNIEEKDSKLIAKMYDGSELEITVKQLQKHGLRCDICNNDSIEDGASEAGYAKNMRNWAKKSGWGYHNGKDYCPNCEYMYNENKKKS